MKNSSLESLRSFEMSRSVAITVNGGGPRRKCIRTARLNGNQFLIPLCKELPKGNY
ncbi:MULTISPECIES: hypothetical protein [Aquimarina]|uniref:hypothetical protein n=1 Tax=Aquimarina TaxID=290174 RepID=UPI00135CB2DC|nr:MULTISPECIES: hypothetical protein [Aquimarina]